MAKNSDGLRDQRMNSRLETSLPCEVRSGESISRGCLHSVSLTGALVSANYDAPIGAPISIILDLPGTGKTVSLRGLVVRSSRSSNSFEKLHHFGVRFHGISADSIMLVKAVLAARDS